MILGVEDWARDEDLLNRGHRDVMRLAMSMVARLVRRLHVLEDGQKHVESGYKRVSQAHARELERLANGLEMLYREHRQQPDSVVRGVSDEVEQLELVRYEVVTPWLVVDCVTIDLLQGLRDR